MNRCAIGLLALLLAGGANAQSLADIERAEAAVLNVWEQTPLSFRRAVFVTEANGFGVYKERENAQFKPGEPLLVYSEPVGYAWKDNGDGTFSFGFNVDLLLKTSSGEIVGGQENFQQLVLTSKARNREFMLTLTLTLTGAPAGDYVVEYRTRDAFGAKSGMISLPFSIVE
jgi:hypothetical protein